MNDHTIKGTEAWKARGPELEVIAAELENWRETRVGLIRDGGDHQISAEVHIRAHGETVVRYRLLSYDRAARQWDENWFDSIAEAVGHAMEQMGATA